MTSLSSNARSVTECPFCRELVAKGAMRCPHCHADLKTPKKKKRPPIWRGPFMLGFYMATVFWIAVIILIFWKF